MQDSPSQFFNMLSGNLTGQINSCMLGKIEKFDPTTMKAQVVPLVKDKPMLIEVPVSFMKAGPFIIRPPYKRGDMVLIVFADADIDNILLTGDVSEPNTNRGHSMDDAIVVGGIMPFTGSLPGEHAEDLIIAKSDLSAKIVISQEGNITIQGGKVFLGSDTAAEGIPLGDTLKEWLDTHTHTAPMGETSSPLSASPSPSQVVKTV